MVNHAPTYRVLRRKREALSLSAALSHSFRVLVGLDGLEPSTSRLSGARSSHLSYRPVFSQAIQFVHLRLRWGIEPLIQAVLESIDLSRPSSTLFFELAAYAATSKNGGDEGNRTLDPLLAGQVLSQLSYTPMLEVRGKSEK